MAEAALVATALLVASQLVRFALASRALAAASAAGPIPGAVPVPTAGPESRAGLDDVTVLVAVRSGDPLLGATLAASVETLAGARVLLLVDDDDPDGADAARRAAAGHPGVAVVGCGPPPAGTNPKVHKLAGAPVTSGTVVVLDDDTLLPPGGLGRLVAGLADADLVTGVPVYREQDGLWSRLVAAFVNGSALLTYLPLARVGPPVTINGMVVALRHDALRGAGGFAAIGGATCDDYALARLFRAHGLTLAQSTQVAVVASTVPSARAYLALMRRWLIFAGEVVRRDLTPRLLTLVLLPTALPALSLGLAVAAADARAVAASVAALTASALGTRALRTRAGRAGLSGGGAAAVQASAVDASTVDGAGIVGVLLEPLALVLAPLQAVAANLGPRTVTWRGRRVAVGIGDAL